MAVLRRSGRLWMRKASRACPSWRIRQSMRPVFMGHSGKPALAYLDIIARAREQFDVPIAAYQVSGEYAMIEAAARAGWIERERIILEATTAIKRAGADILITNYELRISNLLA